MTKWAEVVEIDFGEETEKLGSAILADITETELDEIDVQWTLKPPVDLASEPTAIGVVFCGVAIPYICNCISKYLENRRQRDAAHMLLRAYTHSEEAGEQMAELQRKHADVIKYSRLTLPPSPTLPGSGSPKSKPKK